MDRVEDERVAMDRAVPVSEQGRPAPAAARRRGSPIRRLRRYAPPIVALILVLGIWEIIGRATDPLLFAPPDRTVAALIDMLATGRLETAFVTTLSYLVPGFLISAVTGIGLGILLGRSESWSKLLEPYINVIYSTPRVVLIPLVIVWFGVGFPGRIFIIWLSSAIPILISTAVGIRYARKDLVEAAVSFQATERQLIRHVIIPGAVPFIVSGLRIGAEQSLVGAAIAEVFLSLSGIGGIIQTEAERFNTAYVLAAALVYAVMGWLCMFGLGRLEARFAAWKTN